jgi:hypothetical protein
MSHLSKLVKGMQVLISSGDLVGVGCLSRFGTKLTLLTSKIWNNFVKQEQHSLILVRQTYRGANLWRIFYFSSCG